MTTELFANNFQATLVTACTAGDTTLVMSSAPPSALQTGGQFRVLIDGEIIIVPAQATTNWLGVTRGAEGTTATSHAAGTVVTHLVTAGAIANITGTSGFTNPMTAAGDLIVGGTAGAATRLGLGAIGQYLSNLNGTIGWTTNNVYDPMRFGAKGDGIVDDTAAVQAAANAIPSTGGTLDLRTAPNTFLVSSQITIPLDSGVTVLGTYLARNTGDNNVKMDLTCTAGFTGLAVLTHSAVMSTSSSVPTGVGLSFLGVSVNMTNATQGSGIRTLGRHVQYEGCFILNPPNIGIHLTDVNVGNVTVTGNWTNGSKSVTSLSGTASTTLNGSYTAGSGTMTVNSTDQFPADGGSLTVVGITGTVSYTGSTGTTFTGCSGGTGTASNGAAVSTSKIPQVGDVVYPTGTGIPPGASLTFTSATAGTLNMAATSTQTGGTLTYGYAAGGSAFLTDNYLFSNAVTGYGVSGIVIGDNQGNSTDGYVVNNVVTGNGGGNATANTGWGMAFSNAEDWQVHFNHLRNMQNNGMLLNSCTDLRVTYNYINNVGKAGAANTTYYNMLLQSVWGSAVVMEGNEMRNDESGGAATTVFQYYTLTEHIGSGQTQMVRANNNIVHQTASGSGTSVGWTVNSSTNSTRNILIVGSGNAIFGSNDGIGTGTTTPVVYGGQTSRPVWITPAQTPVIGSSVSLTLGVNNANGTNATILSPLFTSTFIRARSVAITWGGTFGTNEVVNVRLTFTWDDGTTTTTQLPTVTASGAQTIVQQVVSAQLYSAGATLGNRCTLVKASARTQSATTSVTCAIVAEGDAGA